MATNITWDLILISQLQLITLIIIHLFNISSIYEQREMNYGEDTKNDRRINASGYKQVN